MSLSDNFDYGKKQKYIITYKDIYGEKCTMDGEVSSSEEAREAFERNFSPLCKIVKIQTVDEWIDSTSTEIVKGLMKHVKNIDYNSRSFKKGLKKVNEKVAKSSEMSKPDVEKKYLSFNI